MLRHYTLLAVVAVALITSACAGTKFDRIPNGQLTLNGTTEQEVINRLGRPYSVSTRTENGEPVRTLVYVYASSMTAAGLVAGVPSSRAQSFSFFKNKLVGYQYSSNFLGDITRFDEATVQSFKEGVTTRADVIQKLGEPTGESAYPLTDAPADTAVGYQFSFTDTRKANVVAESQSLTIVFGPNDIAKKIVYTTTGRS